MIVRAPLLGHECGTCCAVFLQLMGVIATECIEREGGAE